MRASHVQASTAPLQRWIAWLCCGCDECEPAGIEDESSMPCTNSPSMNGGVVIRIDDLLSWPNVAQLASYLPLQEFCRCEETWDPECEESSIDEDACDCDRPMLVAVRNCLAALLGEPQISMGDGLAALAREVPS